jgi:hypothetical protein
MLCLWNVTAVYQNRVFAVLEFHFDSNFAVPVNDFSMRILFLSADYYTIRSDNTPNLQRKNFLKRGRVKPLALIPFEAVRLGRCILFIIEAQRRWKYDFLTRVVRLKLSNVWHHSLCFQKYYSFQTFRIMSCLSVLAVS